MIAISLPPPAEQAAIARFLAWATNRLDRAIRAKRRIIALLNEQKQAIIHRAVTRGLDPSVPLKDSGVPWLGEIPEHWEARKLGTLFCLQGSGTTPSGERYYGGSINWVMSGDLNNEVVSTTKRSVQAVALEFYSALKLYPPGSLVIAMYGATIGKTGILGKHACTNQACCVLAHPACGAKETFLQLAVQAAKPHLVSEAYGGGQPNINAEVIRALRIGLPPANEQQLILQSINSSTHQLRTAIVRLEREIALLLEYRTRLIADVVTGKLDVREAAAGLPEEAESLDTADQNEVIGELEPDEDEEPELK
ncbi:MAG: restriction endonuclease subunit S [Cyanobium sp.]